MNVFTYLDYKNTKGVEKYPIQIPNEYFMYTALYPWQIANMARDHSLWKKVVAVEQRLE